MKVSGSQLEKFVGSNFRLLLLAAEKNPNPRVLDIDVIPSHGVVFRILQHTLLLPLMRCYEFLNTDFIRLMVWCFELLNTNAINLVVWSFALSITNVIRLVVRCFELSNTYVIWLCGMVFRDLVYKCHSFRGVFKCTYSRNSQYSP